MKNPAPSPDDDPWTRLAAAARRAPAPPAPAAEEDFAAQVVSRWLNPPPASAPAPVFFAPLWEAWSLRGLAAAGALALAVLAFSFPALRDATGSDVLSLDPLDALLADF